MTSPGQSSGLGEGSLHDAARAGEAALRVPARGWDASGRRTLRVAVIAGEVSGDALAAGLMRALAARVPRVEFEGIAGPEMQAVGCTSLYPMERLSVMGLVEGLGRYPELAPVRARLKRRFLARPPDLFIGVDAPEFNLSLAHRLRRAGVSTVHYVSPSVWAWRRYRVRKIARAIDLMLVLFPFEARFYRERGVPVEFVGHPLADAIPEESDAAAARASLGLRATGPLIALLPGSRVSEVRRLARPFLETARWLAGRRPELGFAVPLANELVAQAFRRELERHGCGPPVTLFDGRAREVMAAADAVLLASGTAALEAMLLKRPMVITYRVGAINYFIVRPWVSRNVAHVGLPNLLAGRTLVPELLQGDVVADKLGPPLFEFLERRERVVELRRECSRLHRELRRGASERAAEAVLALASSRRAL